MGFRYKEIKAIFGAEVKDGKLRVHIPGGMVMEYDTSIKVDIPLQHTGFTGKGVAFCLEADNIVYIGRTNGSWTGYRISDNFLMKQGTWAGMPKLVEAGNFVSDMMAETVYTIHPKCSVFLLSDTSTAFISEKEVNIADKSRSWFVGNPLLNEQLLLFTEEGTRDYTAKVKRERIPFAPPRYSLG